VLTVMVLPERLQIVGVELVKVTGSPVVAVADAVVYAVADIAPVPPTYKVGETPKMMNCLVAGIHEEAACTTEGKIENKNSTTIHRLKAVRELLGWVTLIITAHRYPLATTQIG
jgi:hypothetical protein